MMEQEYDRFNNEEILNAQNAQQIGQRKIISARELKLKRNRTYSNSSLKTSNGRNMSKYIIKQFFNLVLKQELEPTHRAVLMQIQKRAKDTGNTKHLKQLFGKGTTEAEQKRNQINRQKAQQLISKKFIHEIVKSNSIKDPVNYICTCLCYMYRLNYSQTAESGVALMRNDKKV